MRAIVFGALLLACSITHAQTTDEWLKQKETKKKYLLQQIAALKIYLTYAEKGYAIAHKGLQTIHSIKKGDFNLHNDFFNSLKQVNPVIKNWSRVADIIAVQVMIVRQVKEAIASVKQNGQFTQDEMDYCKIVFNRLLVDCLNDIDELVLVTTSGELEMKDNERIKRIENLWLDMQDKYVFSTSFADEMKALSVQRMSEQNEIGELKVLSK